MNYKSISFRLNMDDLEEANLYQSIMEESNGYVSLSSFMRMVIKEHFNLTQQEEEYTNLKKFIQQKFDELDDRISLGIAVNNVATKESLPDECDCLPDKLASVLDMFE